MNPFKKKKKDIKVALCIPCPTQYVLKDFFVNLMSLVKVPNVEMTLNITEYEPKDFNRNRLIQQALKDSGTTHVWFLDPNIVPPRDALPQMLNVNDDITGMLCFRNTKPYAPDMYRTHPTDPNLRRVLVEYKPGEVVKPDSISAGCMMIKREVLEEMKYPWFEFSHENNQIVADDVNFCRKVRESGYSISCITRPSCRNLDIHGFGEGHWTIFRDEEMVKQESDGVNFKTEE